MQEILEQILIYLRGIWNKRWYAMAIAWVICIIGWITVYNMPDQYQTRARIYIDTQSLLQPLLRGLTVQIDINQQIDLMVKTLLSRPNIEKIIQLSDLDLGVTSQEENEQLIKKLKNKIKFKKAAVRTSNNLYDLSYVDNNKEKGKDVLQSVLTVFIENSLGKTREDADSAITFLDMQIARYEKRLLAAESRLKDFKQKNMALLPSTGADYYSKMQHLAEVIEDAKLELKEATTQMETIQAELDQARLSISSDSENITSSYDGRILALEQQLDNLLLQYTHTHPDVVSVKSVLNRLNKKREKEVAEKREKAADNQNADLRLDENPVYQQIKINLGAVNAQVETLKVRVATYTNRHEKLKEMVNTIPEIEAKLASLNRDYEVTNEQYNEFLTRRESATIAENVDKTTDSIQFKVIESPRVEKKPVGPPRLLLATVALVIGLLAGIAFAFVLSQITPVVLSANELSGLTGLPMLGAVSAIATPVQMHRRKILIISYLSLLALLLAVYGIIMTWFTVLLQNAQVL